MERYADPEVAAGQKAYMRGKFEFLGVKTPDRRRASKSFIASHGPQVVPDLWAEPEREFQYVGADMLWAKVSQLSSADVEWLGGFVQQKSWWDTVDALAKTIGQVATAQQMLTWSVADNLWLRRVAIIHQLRRKTSTDAALLARIIVNNVGSTEFYINKAIGWALREYSKTDTDWVRGFVATHELSRLSQREALKRLGG
ncbi:DNA alkylation repair protein [Corynebacterium matruchotii]|uniref:DNA alkylation repair protein n=1 Tax=Corynebacterium matruchotii TaxID=43768 RepID=UPI003C6FB479